MSSDAIPTSDGRGCSKDFGRNSGINVVGKGEGEGSEAERGVVVVDHASCDFRWGMSMVI